MYQFVLFVHFLALILAFLATGMLYGATVRLHQASTVAEARSAVSQQNAAAKFPPLAGLLLFASGAYLTQSAWTWTTPWIDCGIAGLVAVMAMGGGVLGRRARALGQLLARTPDGALDAALRQRLNDKVLAVGEPAVSIFVLAIVLLMVMKPNLALSIATLAAGALAGIAVGMASSSEKTAPAPSAAAAAETGVST